MAADAAVPAGLLVTHSAPTNIAVIKYWGKRDLKLNLPINSSVSVTLNQDDLRATTSVAASTGFEADRLWLNGKEESIANPRVQAVLREVRARAGDKLAADGTVLVSKADWAGYKFHIVSENNFPTAAGLASSAAGYACLVSVLCDLCGVKETYPGELTTIARQGSGSSCRSLYGGFVRWSMGTAEDGSDSLASQVADAAHWPEMEALILVVSDLKKETGSTVGMKNSVKTSKLLAHRAAEVVEGRMAAMEAAWLKKDFDTFAKITMQDSNQFHACCLDTYPPIFYMNDVSKRIIGFVHKLNESAGRTVAAYTFDAGPNAVLYARKADMPLILALVLRSFPGPAAAASGSGDESKTGEPATKYVNDAALEEAAAAVEVSEAFSWSGTVPCSGVKYIYHTTVGDGPRTYGLEESLIDPSSGLPKRVVA